MVECEDEDETNRYNEENETVATALPRCRNVAEYGHKRLKQAVWVFHVGMGMEGGLRERRKVAEMMLSRIWTVGKLYGNGDHYFLAR